MQRGPVKLHGIETDSCSEMAGVCMHFHANDPCEQLEAKALQQSESAWSITKIRGAAMSSGVSNIGAYRLQAADAAGSEPVEARRVHEALDRLWGERRARH